MDRVKLRNNIAARVQKWRAQSELTRDQVAERIGVCERTIKRWENAQSEPNATDLILMEQASPGIVAAIFTP
jgi:transcriptional regulator with XRE-family HTH domain